MTGASGSPRVAVAIPVHDEAATVAAVVGAVRLQGITPIVFDDGSTDGSGDLARAAGATVLSHARNRGYGATIISILRHAAASGLDWVITMDCDDQHEPASIPDFLAAIGANDADVISGSRYLVESALDDSPPADRQRVNRVITHEVNAALGLSLTDAFCGFKAFRARACAALPLSATGYEFPLEFWARAAQAGLRIREIPVRRIYVDPSRSFGGELDDPAIRLARYRATFRSAIETGPPVAAPRPTGERCTDRHGCRSDAPCCCSKD